MDWASIRTFYLQCVHERQLTQTTIVARGGLSSQSVLSRMLKNEKHGPTIDVFVAAVQGLGMEVNQFFLELKTFEQQRQARAEVRDVVHPLVLPDARQSSSPTRDDIRAAFTTALAEAMSAVIERYLDQRDTERDRRPRSRTPGARATAVAGAAGTGGSRRRATSPDAPGPAASSEGPIQPAPTDHNDDRA